MKALRVLSPNNINLLDAEELIDQPNSTIINPTTVGICGTDLAIISGSIDPAFIKYPITIGHEWVGKLANGQRVVAEGIIPCDLCDQCKTGNTNRCSIYNEIGFTQDGAIAEEIRVPDFLLHKINNNVSDESALLVDPASVVTQGLLKVNPRSNLKVLVIGEGTIGLLAATIVREFHPSKVVMLGLKKNQVELAFKSGIDQYFTNPSKIREKFDLIIECSGAMVAIQNAFKLCARGGSFLLLGYTESPESYLLQVDDLINNDQSIFASFGYSRKAWLDVVAKLNNGSLDLTFVVSHQFKLKDWENAISTMKTNDQPRGKVSIRITEGK